jgi:hypothetical protein
MRSLFSSFMYFCLVLFCFSCWMCIQWKPCIYGGKSIVCIDSRCIENRHADFLKILFAGYGIGSADLRLLLSLIPHILSLFCYDM